MSNTDQTRLLSTARAEGRPISWPGPRRGAFPVDADGPLIDDRCMEHEFVPGGRDGCPLCRGTGRRNETPTKEESLAHQALVAVTKTKLLMEADILRARLACRKAGVECPIPLTA